MYRHQTDTEDYRTNVEQGMFYNTFYNTDNITYIYGIVNHPSIDQYNRLPLLFCGRVTKEAALSEPEKTLPHTLAYPRS